MKRRALACALALALAFLAVPAIAQTYRDSGGTIIPGVVPAPFPFTPLPPGQHNLAPTSSTALTIPTGARYAMVCASTANVEYTTDGATTAAAGLGMPLWGGACVVLSGPLVLANFRAVSATGTLDVEFFK